MWKACFVVAVVPVSAAEAVVLARNWQINAGDRYYSTQLAKMSIDPKFVELKANVVKIIL